MNAQNRAWVERLITDKVTADARHEEGCHELNETLDQLTRLKEELGLYRSSPLTEALDRVRWLRAHACSSPPESHPAPQDIPF